MKTRQKIALLFVLGTTGLGVTSAFATPTFNVTNLDPVDKYNYPVVNTIGTCSFHATIHTDNETVMFGYDLEGTGPDGVEGSDCSWLDNNNVTLLPNADWTMGKSIQTNPLAAGNHTVQVKITGYQMSPQPYGWLGTLPKPVNQYTVGLQPGDGGGDGNPGGGLD